MKRVTKYLIVILSFVFTTQLTAKHIVGGEIIYDYLGGNQYKITLKMYRDCGGGGPPLANPVLIRIFDKNGVLVDSMKIQQLSLTNIAPTINNPCITPPSSACVEEGIYIDTIKLLPKIGGYDLVYQSCCRNNSILNIVNPGGTGVTYWEHIPGSEVVAINSSPHFNNFPPIYLCNGVQIKFNHLATDPDGDALVYSLCDPYDGCSPPPGGNCPVMPPPYAPVQFVSPYSGSFPMSSNPALNINSATGYLTGTPDIDGQWVVGVCVQEWRGATLLGTHYRDFQFNVVTCSISVLAQFNDQSNAIIVNNVPVPNQFCNGFTVQFSNNSINGTTFLWNFGDPTTSADTSNFPNPNYTYPDTGAYQVSLIANPGKPCADTIKKTYYIYPVLSPTLSAPPPQCIKGNSFSFNVGGLFAPTYSTFNWNFGINASIITSTVQSPSGVVYNAAGSFPFTLLVKQKMCQKLLKDTVEVYPLPKSNFNADSVTGCDPVVLTFTNSSTAGGTPSYLWQFGNGGTSTLANPTHSFTPAGVYGVTLTVISNAGCIDTSKFVVPGMVTVTIRPTAGFSLTPTETTIFDPDITFTDQSVNGTSWYYTFGDGGSSLSPNPFHTYTTHGDFTIVQTVVNGFGCPDTAVRIVHILPEFRFWVPNAFTPKNKDGLNDVFLPIVFGVEEYSFEIYDRWGECIFKTKDTQKAWDGTRLGSPCQQDVYVWMITFFNLVTKRDEVHYGSVTIWK